MKISKTLIAIIILILGLGAAGWYVLSRDTADSSGSSSTTNPPTDTDDDQNEPSGEEVIREGVFVCLPHKNTEGPQTLECAFGMQADDGTYYALQDSTSDYSLVGSVGAGSRIRVKGTLKLEESDRYQSIGNILITSLDRL